MQRIVPFCESPLGLSHNRTMITVYGIPNCDTVKKARTWLDEHGQAYDFHDFKKAGISAATIDRWMSAVDWETLLNRRGTTWRKLTPEQQARVQDAASASALMQEQTSLIKRPVVDWGSSANGKPDLSVGFSPDEWSRRL